MCSLVEPINYILNYDYRNAEIELAYFNDERFRNVFLHCELLYNNKHYLIFIKRRITQQIVFYVTNLITDKSYTFYTISKKGYDKIISLIKDNPI